MTDLICDMPVRERPRERLTKHGVSSLSETELVAVLLGSGTRGVSALSLARQLVSDGVPPLIEQNADQLVRIKGVGPAKACRIAAALELSRRWSQQHEVPKDDFELTAFGTMLVRTESHHRQEHLGAAFLDARHRIMRRCEIFIGTVNYAVVSTREIVMQALVERAVAVVLYHNHPSGNAHPSPEDEAFTAKVDSALKLVDIQLQDHIVIGKHSFFSMREKGRLC